MAFGDPGHDIDDTPGAIGVAPVLGLDATLGVLAEPGGAGRSLVGPVLPGEPAAVEG